MIYQECTIFPNFVKNKTKKKHFYLKSIIWQQKAMIVIDEILKTFASEIDSWSMMNITKLQTHYIDL